MKNFKSRTLDVLGRIFNLRAWIDYDRLKEGYQYFFDGLKKLFVPQVTEARDFNEVMKEKGVTEEDLKVQKRALKRLSYFMFFITCLAFAYTLYLLLTGHWLALMLSSVVSLLAAVLAFRYHYWYFQMQQRKLGCTIEEWYRIGLKGEKE